MTVLAWMFQQHLVSHAVLWRHGAFRETECGVKTNASFTPKHRCVSVSQKITTTKKGRAMERKLHNINKSKHLIGDLCINEAEPWLRCLFSVRSNVRSDKYTYSCLLPERERERWARKSKIPWMRVRVFLCVWLLTVVSVYHSAPTHTLVLQGH